MNRRQLLNILLDIQRQPPPYNCVTSDVEMQSTQNSGVAPPPYSIVQSDMDASSTAHVQYTNHACTPDTETADGGTNMRISTMSNQVHHECESPPPYTDLPPPEYSQQLSN